MSFLKKKLVITVLVTLILLALLTVLSLYLFSDQNIFGEDYIAKYHKSPSSQIEVTFKDGDINICSAENTNREDSSQLQKVYDFLEKENLNWIIYSSQRSNVVGIVTSYIKIEEKSLNDSWKNLTDNKKAEAISFVTQEIANEYNLDNFRIWIITCENSSFGKLDKEIGFSSYEPALREQSEPIEIYFDW